MQHQPVVFPTTPEMLHTMGPDWAEVAESEPSRRSSTRSISHRLGGRVVCKGATLRRRRDAQTRATAPLFCSPCVLSLPAVPGLILYLRRMLCIGS